jgi:hypoxanthine phosphoribosyltransferase
MSNTPKPLIHKEQIAERVEQLAGEIRAAYAGQKLTVLGAADDSFIFMSDLIRAINVPMQCSFLKVSEYHDEREKDILYMTEVDLRDADVLLVKTVVDTGVVPDYLVKHFRNAGVRNIRLVALVDKPDFRHIEFTPDFVGFTRSEKMIVGYGLGVHDEFRYLPFLAAIEE